MRGFENEGILNALTNKVVDRKKAPVVDLFVDVLPVRQQIMLLSQDRFERRETGWILRLTSYAAKILRNKIADLRILRHKLAQPLPQRFEPLPAVGARISRGSSVVSQGDRGRGDTRIFLKRRRIVAKRFAELIQTAAQDQMVRGGSEGEE